ncbi:hypothetical protein M9X92_009587 [Pyricularia oryzae]|nr:hypothetical protein M9X92_009587 [Pyricularia oryzae]
MMEPTKERHDYANIDEHDDGRSSTEVDESLMGMDEEKHYSRRDHMLPSRRPKTLAAKLLAPFKSGRWLIDTALLLVIIGLLVKDKWKEVGNPWQIGGDITGVGPKFSSQIQTFHVDQSFAPSNTSEFFSDEVLARWNSLMPRGMGFQWVNNTHKYHDLPTPIVWDEGMTVFTTSVTHNLHCLFAIVQTYSGLKSGHELPDDHHWHMIHCFDYMRQAIMCSADMALEGLETTFPDHNGGSDGWDSKHVCKDWSQVKGYLESVRAYDDKLIY